MVKSRIIVVVVVVLGVVVVVLGVVVVVLGVVVVVLGVVVVVIVDPDHSLHLMKSKLDQDPHLMIFFQVHQPVVFT